MTQSTVISSNYPTYTGQCYCGQVQFTVSGSHKRTDLCHCSECRISTGGIARLNGKWRRDHLYITAGEQLIQSWPNSRSKKMSFCRQCGTTLWRSSIVTPTNAADDIYSVYLPTLHQCGNRNTTTGGSNAQGGYAEWPSSLVPAQHLYYPSRMRGMYDRVQDGLPKWATLGSDDLADKAQQVQYNEQSSEDAATVATNGVRHVECACGAVQATLSSDNPLRSAACHCSICRLICSAEYAIWLIVPQQDLQVVQGSQQLRTTRVGTAMEVTWCSTCGVPLWLKDDDDNDGSTVEISPQSIVEFSGKTHKGAGYLPPAWQPVERIQFHNRLGRSSWADDGLPIRVGDSRSEHCDASGNTLASTASPHITLTDLSAELIQCIFQYLTCRELITTVNLTNQASRVTVQDDTTWSTHPGGIKLMLGSSVAKLMHRQYISNIPTTPQPLRQLHVQLHLTDADADRRLVNRLVTNTRLTERLTLIVTAFSSHYSVTDDNNMGTSIFQPMHQYHNLRKFKYVCHTFIGLNLSTLVCCWKQLTSLTVDSDLIKSEQLASCLVKHCPQLTKLTSRQCWTRYTVLQLSALDHLQKLSLYIDAYETTLQAVFALLPALRQVKLKSTRFLTIENPIKCLSPHIERIILRPIELSEAARRSLPPTLPNLRILEQYND